MFDRLFKNLTLSRSPKPSRLWPFDQSKLYRWLLAPHCGKRMCFHADVETYELNLQNVSSVDREILFHNFFPKEKTNNPSLLEDAQEDEESCFYSIVLLSQFKKQSAGRPHVKAHIWINFEKNHEYSDSDNIASTHHIEVYRSQSHQHRVELRIFFTILVLFETFRQQQSSKVITFYEFRPLIIFIWLSLVSFSPKTFLEPWDNANEAVTSSTYLVVFASSLGASAMLNSPHMTGLTLLRSSIVVIALSCAIYWAVFSFESPFLFPNAMSPGILNRVWVSLILNLIVRVGLRQFEATKLLDPAAQLLAVVGAHTIVLFLTFVIFPPDRFNYDCEFKFFNHCRFMIIRWIEVHMRSFVMHFFLFNRSAGARPPSPSAAV